MNNKAFAYSGSAGFTLHELLIVVFIAGVIALVVAAGSQALQSLPLQRAAQLLSADIDYARVRSVGDPTDPCIIVFREDGAGYHVARRSAPGTPLASAGGNIMYSTVFGGVRGHGLTGVTVSQLDAVNNHTVEFTGYGSLNQGADAGIVLQAGKRAARITIDATTGELSIANVNVGS